MTTKYFKALHAEERSRLRDEFALAALQGFLAHNGFVPAEEQARLARNCYELAEAMMNHREQG
jgi:hypothetical protein